MLQLDQWKLENSISDLYDKIFQTTNPQTSNTDNSTQIQSKLNNFNKSDMVESLEIHQQL